MNPATGEYSANPRRSRIARPSSRVWGQTISANHVTDTINYSTHRGFHVRVTKVVASQCFWRLMRGRIKGSENSLRANFARAAANWPWQHLQSLPGAGYISRVNALVSFSCSCSGLPVNTSARRILESRFQSWELLSATRFLPQSRRLMSRQRSRSLLPPPG